MKNEKTSSQVASEAGRLLKKRWPIIKIGGVNYNLVRRKDMIKMRQVLASALTQAADRRKK